MSSTSSLPRPARVAARTITLTAALALTLAACSASGEQRTTPTTGAETTVTTAPPTTDPPETTTTEAPEPTTTTTEPIDDDVLEADWFDSADSFDLELGDTATVSCEADGYVSSVWGSEVYTSDSSICTAAVYEGRIEVADGGLVSVEVIEGQDVYDAGEANGVETMDETTWDASFRLIEDPAGG